MGENDIPEISHIFNGLYIGSSRALYDTTKLRTIELTHIVKLYFGDPECPTDFTVYEGAFEDGGVIPTDILTESIDFIENYIQSGTKVLVACGAGMSRSAALALAYLMEKQGYNLRYAWKLVKFHHAIADVAPQLWDFLLKRYQQPYSITEILLRW